ncbi:MAG: hypothetical protein HY738_08050 [Bacteroidia bacterium]|nr:hypothetical protein [Bacteroidia bacterium]
MIQIFLKKSKISKNDWDNAFQRILKIVKEFPLQLERIEAYNGFERNLNKVHYELIVNRGKPDEHISFWGDRMSFTAAFTLIIYKNWEYQVKEILVENEIDENKPITWYKPEIFKNYGYPPEANGSKFNQSYLNTSATYRYAVLAIGIMLENILPGRAFMIAMETDFKDIEKTRHETVQTQHDFRLEEHRL